MKKIITLVIINIGCFSLDAQLAESEKKIELLQKKEKEVLSNWALNPLDVDFQAEKAFKQLISKDAQQDYIDERIDTILRTFLKPINDHLTLNREEIERKAQIERLEREKHNLEMGQEIYRNKKQSKIAHSEKEEEKRRQVKIENIKTTLEQLMIQNSKARELSPRDPEFAKKMLQEIKSFIVMYRGWVGLDHKAKFPELLDFPYGYRPWFDTLLKINDFNTDRLELIAFLYCIFKNLQDDFKVTLNDELVMLQEKLEVFQKKNTTETAGSLARKGKIQTAITGKKNTIEKEVPKFYMLYARDIGDVFLKRAEQGSRIITQYLLSQSFVNSFSNVKEDDEAVPMVFTPRQTDKTEKINELAKNELRKQRNGLKEKLANAIENINYWLYKSRAMCPYLQKKEQHKIRYEILENQLKKLSDLLFLLIQEDIDKGGKILEKIDKEFTTKFISCGEAIEMTPKEYKALKRQLQEYMGSVAAIARDMLGDATLLKDANPEKALKILCEQYDSALLLRTQMKNVLGDFEHPYAQSESSPKISTLNSSALASVGSISLSKKSIYLKGELEKKLQAKKEAARKAKKEAEEKEEKIEEKELLTKPEQLVEEIVNEEALRKELLENISKIKAQEKKKKSEEIKEKPTEEELEAMMKEEVKQPVEEERGKEKSKSPSPSPRSKHILNDPKFDIFKKG